MKLNIIVFLLIIFSACNSSKTQNQNAMDHKDKYQFTNNLINETSPYLLQHAHNPVDWYPWGEEALKKAKSENKMLLISIGYAACHWCHVMEHESFEDEQVAAIMNEHFVCIKVDREERPDIDHQYMDAVQLMTGTGGWPLNCFALPDGRPVYGGTYFRKDQWVSLLNQLAEMYENDRPKILEYADQTTAGLKDYNLVNVNAYDNDFNEKKIKEIVENWKNYFDMKWGGNKGAPKFPMPNNFMFLLEYYYFTQDESVKDYIELSLDKMAQGGIYDQIGGGFARYSTDANWKVPHFEKMLYDNAQLVIIYSKAYTLFKKPEYKSIVFETVAFLKRELYVQNKGFFSSIDADSESEEGLFYVWKKNELDDLLGKNAPIFNAYFNISENGNWESGQNILFQEKSLIELANDFGLLPKEVENNLTNSKKLVFEKRQKRKRPMTDDKVLTSWNAMAISALTTAYRAFGEKQFLKDALSTANFIKETRVTQDGKVFRMTKKDGTMLSGFLDDYSFLSQSFIDLYQATFDEQWLLIAEKITQFAIAEFYDDSTCMFFYSAKSDKSLLTPKTEISDNVIPSSNSSIALVMKQLSVYFDDEDLSSKSRKMMNNIYPQMKKNGAYYSNWGILLSNMIYSPPEVVFCGENASKLREVFDQNFQVSTMAGNNGFSDMPLLENRYVEGKTYVYVCKNKTCKLPVQTVKEALKEMHF